MSSRAKLWDLDCWDGRRSSGFDFVACTTLPLPDGFSLSEPLSRIEIILVQIIFMGGYRNTGTIRNNFLEVSNRRKETEGYHQQKISTPSMEQI